MRVYNAIGWVTFAFMVLAMYQGKPIWSIFWLLATLSADAVSWGRKLIDTIEDIPE